MVSQYHMSCGHPTYQKLFAGYIRGVRGPTATLGSTWILPGNHLLAYFDLLVVVWSNVEGLGLTEEAARLLRHPLQQSQATP